MRAVTLLNLDTAYSSVLKAVKSHRLDVLSKEHWEIWQMIRQADEEDD